jgi:glycosyltransferase 2 family protein
MRGTLGRFSSSRSFRWSLGLLAGLLALYLAGKDIHFREVWSVLRKAIPGYVVLAFGSVLVNIFSKILRWRVLLGAESKNAGFLLLTVAKMMGQLVNLFVPGRVGELSQVLVIGRRVKQGRTFVLGTIVLEKWFDLLAYALLFLILFMLVPLPDWMEGSVFTLTGIIVFGGVVLAGTVYYHAPFSSFLVKLVKHFPERFQGWILPRIETAFSSIMNLRKGADLLAIIFWTTIVWGTAILNHHFIMQALRINLPFSSMLLLVVSLQAGIVSAASPGALGVFEYICVLALGVFGVSQVVALGYGFLLHAIVLIPQIVGGLLSFVVWGMMAPSIPAHSVSKVE